MTESESVALPLGDTPIYLTIDIISNFSSFVNPFSKIFSPPEKFMRRIFKVDGGRQKTAVLREKSVLQENLKKGLTRGFGCDIMSNANRKTGSESSKVGDAGVAELADARDLKSRDTRVSYRFDPGHRHHRKIYRGVEQSGQLVGLITRRS